MLIPKRVVSRGSTPAGFVALLLAAGACSSSKSSETTTDAGASEVGPSADDAGGGGDATGDAALVGGFIVELVAAVDTTPAHTNVSGRVYDGPTPAAIVWDQVGQAGDCSVSKPRAPFCDPPCSGGDVCIENQHCAKQPTSLDLGAVRVRGLTVPEFMLTSISKSYQLPNDVSLPYPPALEGSEVDVIVPGGAYGPFMISSVGIAPLSSPGDALTIQKSSALQLTWTAPAIPGPTRIQIEIDISRHGGGSGKIDCDAADTGSVEIGAELITKLIDLGVAGFPEVTLTRVATGSTVIQPGWVRFQVISSVTRPLQIPGFVSCHEATDCPDGKACQTNDLCQQ